VNFGDKNLSDKIASTNTSKAQLMHEKECCSDCIVTTFTK